MLFQQWKYKFTSWLCFGDCRCSEALDNLEKKSEAPPLSSGNADEKQMSQKLFAVLTSYLRGKCAHMVRAKAKNKDGFRFCHSLNHEYMPSRRQRSLASAQALGAYPCFNKDKSALEPILNFEQLVMQYEEASAVCIPKSLWQQPSSDAASPIFENSFNFPSLMKPVTETSETKSQPMNAWPRHGPVIKSSDMSMTSPVTPVELKVMAQRMEVDRVEKGKRKTEGKGKNKGFAGGEWASGWLYGRGRGRGRPNKGKGKGKSKGKKGCYSKGGTKGKKAGRGKVAYGQCSNSLEYGHWAKDCPHMVNQVTGKQEPVAPNIISSSYSAYSQSCKHPSCEKKIQFGNAPSSPSSATSPATSYVRMVLVHDVDEGWMHMSWGDEDGEWVILDSGSDVSLLPARFQADSLSGFTPGTLQNCQRGSLQTSGVKKAVLVATTLDGEKVLLQHDFIVGNVTFCLVSLGQL